MWRRGRRSRFLNIHPSAATKSNMSNICIGRKSVLECRGSPSGHWDDIGHDALVVDVVGSGVVGGVDSCAEHF